LPWSQRGCTDGVDLRRRSLVCRVAASMEFEGARQRTGQRHKTATILADVTCDDDNAPPRSPLPVCASARVRVHRAIEHVAAIKRTRARSKAKLVDFACGKRARD